MTRLSTARLDLRLLDERDAALYARLYTCPRVMAQIGPPLDAVAAERAFTAAVAHNRRALPGHRTFAVFDRADGAAVGIGALARSGARAEIGLMLLPDAWDGRRSHEVLDALVAYGFGPMRVDGLDAVCRLGPNVRASRRLVQPYGFTEVVAERPGTMHWRLARDAWRPRAEVGSVAIAE